MSINTSSITAFVVLNSAKVVDVDASVDNYRKSLETYVSASAVDGGEIHDAVTQFFAKQPDGAHVTGLASFVLSAMSPSPDNLKFLQQGIQSFLVANTGEVGEALLGMRKGIGGGHWLWETKKADSKEVKTSLETIKKREAAKAAE